MEAYEKELQTVDELQHLGEFIMKPPYKFWTHEEDPLHRLYSKLDPNGITSNSVEEHHFLNQGNANDVSRTRVCIWDLREVIDMEIWRPTAAFTFESMQPAPDKFFDEDRNPGSTPSYQWYTKIKASCRNLLSALMRWPSCDEEFDFEFRDRLEGEYLPNHIPHLNRMHPELCGIVALIHVAE